MIEVNWYGNKEKEGLKEKIIKEETELQKKGESKMMKMPIIKSEDFLRLTKKQKNGKAAGTDGIKAEVLKHLCKNKISIEIIVESIN